MVIIPSFILRSACRRRFNRCTTQVGTRFLISIMVGKNKLVLQFQLMRLLSLAPPENSRILAPTECFQNGMSLEPNFTRETKLATRMQLTVFNGRDTFRKCTADTLSNASLRPSYRRMRERRDT